MGYSVQRLISCAQQSFVKRARLQGLGQKQHRDEKGLIIDKKSPCGGGRRAM